MDMRRQGSGPSRSVSLDSDDALDLDPWSLWSDATVASAWGSPPREITREAAREPTLLAKLSGGLVAGRKLATLALEGAPARPAVAPGGAGQGCTRTVQARAQTLTVPGRA